MKRKSTDKPLLHRYFLPEYGISVMAESIEAAVKLAEATTKQESGDGE